VIKSHHGSEGMDAWLAAEGARVILSVRDPRDASLSMAQRFNVGSGGAALNQSSKSKGGRSPPFCIPDFLAADQAAWAIASAMAVARAAKRWRMAIGTWRAD